MKTKLRSLAPFALLAAVTPAAQAQIRTAGTLYVDLRATNSTAGGNVWLNEANGFGAGMNFTNAGSFSINTNVAGFGIPGVFFGGTSAYVGPRTTPDLDGASDRSIEVWVLNPAITGEETLVAWAHRGGNPDGSNLSFNYGTDLGFGAVGHWGGARDVGWVTAANIPVSNQWHHFVYTYDGATNVQVYVDGAVRAGRALAPLTQGGITYTNLATWANEAIMIGAQRAATNGAPDQLRLNGFINTVRVHGGRLSAEDIAANYETGPTIPPTGVRILTQPQPLTTREGGPASFAITKLGSAPVTYQWFRNGAPIAGATNSSYTIASAAVGDHGAGYSVVASNFLNNTAFTATSGVAQLTVLPFVPAAQSLVHRYSFNGDARDAIGGAHGTLQGAATISGGQVRLNGTAGTYVNLPPRLLDGLDAVTVEFWASFGVNGNFARVFDFGNTNGTAGIRYMFFTHRAGNATTLRQAIIDPLTEKNTSATTATYDNRTNIHVACVFDPLTGFMGFYTNGVLASSIPNLVTLTNVDNVFSFLGRSVFAADPLLNGSIDEFRIYSQPLSASQVASNFLSGPDAAFAGGPPVFVRDLQDQTVAETAPVTLLPTVSGAAPIRYQWLRNGVAVPGATNGFFAIASAGLNDSGNYQVIATGTSSATSRVARLTVVSPVASLRNRWTFDTDARDSVGTAHGVLTNSAAGAAGPRLTNGAVVMNGGGQYVDLPNNLVTNYTSMTVETWVTDTGSGTWARIYDFGNSTAGEGAAGNGTQYMFLTSPAGNGGLRFALTVGTGEQLAELVPTPLASGVRRHIVWTMDAVSRTARMYVDGAQVAANVAFTFTPAGMGPTVNNWVGRSQFGADAFFNGRIDDLRIYDSALAPGSIQRTFALGPDFLPSDGPVQFVLQPSAVTVTEKAPAVTFSAVATGRNPISAQWFRNGTAVPNATNFTFTFNATVADDNATYRVWATNNVSGTNFVAASSNVVLRVTADTVPPTVVRVQNVGTSVLEITYSEAVAGVTATNLANYSISGVAINTGTLSADGRVVTLATGPLALGVNYTLRISNVTDTATSPNAISPNPTVVSFTAQAYAISDIGASGVGSVITVGGGVDLVGGGQGTGVGTARTNDQITFAYQNVTGDFDMQVRLNSMRLAGGLSGDVWARAGLMARESSADNARFAATFATPGLAGAFFQTRTTVNGAAQSIGSFPVDYPNTWLRLRRVGNSFDGFASLDGITWSFLGSATMTVPATLQVGFAASADAAAAAALSVQIRDIGPGIGIISTNLTLPFEPLAATSRKTALVISEIMYNPPDAWAGPSNLEWIELFNSGVAPEDLTGHRFTGDISFTFPAGTTLQPGEFLLIARDPAAFSSFYGGLLALGPWTGNLENNGGTLRLVNELGGRLLEIDYDNENDWPVGADGTGHSLVLRRASYGENNPRAWGHSRARGGSPGRADPAPPALTAVINEFSQGTNGFIELRNLTGLPLDLGNYILTDDPATNRYVFQAFSIIPPFGYLSVSSAALRFSPDPTDGHLYLMLPDGSVLDAVEFGPYTGFARGRFPNGSSYWSEMRAATPGAANTAPLQRDVIINEIMYHPISESNDDEYIELYNRGTGAVSLAGWRIRGGVDFNFPSHASIPARGFVVVAENLTVLLARYTNLTTANAFGNYSGSLANGGERIALQIPVRVITAGPAGPRTNDTHATVNEVTYGDGGRWGRFSDGGGSSLELVDPRADGRFAANWADSDESAKAPWTVISNTAPLLNGQTDQNGNIIANGAPTRFEFFLQDAGEALVDDLEMRNNGGANLVSNPGFESGATGFNFNGTHRRSFVQSGGAASGANALRLVATGRGDAGPNKVWAPITQLTVNNPLQTGTPSATNTGTMRAQVRWLKGSPYIMFRTRGHWMETTLRLNLPERPGTPGAPNSRLLANAGPAISDVIHDPILPAAGQAVTVSARITDPDGPGAVTLRYRLDPATTFTNVTMRDDGTGGDAVPNDGVFSAVIPGFAANALVAFRVEALDDSGVGATFPAEPLQECLVRFGEAQVAGSLGAYRLWLTASNVTAWTGRERNANDPLDTTFVYGNSRVVYNAGAHYSGSPWHTLNAPYNGPAATPIPDYELNFPRDDMFLGASAFVLAAFDVNQAVGTFFADRAVQNEATGNWIARKLGQQYNHRRHVHVFFNGARRGTIYEDAQQPNGDMLDQYFPNDERGDLRKIEDWFEFQDNGLNFTVNTRSDIGSQSAYLLRINDNSGAVDSKRYRWTFRPRATDNPNDWFNLTNMIVAVNTPGTGADFVSNTLAWVDMRNFMRPIAAHHIAGDWDSFGYERGKNMYAYKPDNQGWRLLMWDIELGLGHSQSRSPVDGIYRVPHDPIIAKMFITPRFQREYLNALLEACNGPLAPGVPDVLLDARYAQFLKNGLPVISPDYIKNFIAARREYILAQIPVSPFTVDGPGSFGTTNPVMTISGLAPISASDIVIDGRSVASTWSTLTNWAGTFRLAPGTNRLVVRALDGNGTELTNVTVTAVLEGGAAWPALRINEWMADNAGIVRDPADGDADDWFELYNPTASAVDLTGWSLTDNLANKTQFVIPSGYSVPARGFALVWADGETGQNGPGRSLHVNFQLSLNGESIGLFAPDGQLIDSVTFGPQAENVSQGRSPDGSTLIIALPAPTPGGTNATPEAIRLNVSLADNTVSLSFNSVLGRTYRVEYKDDLLNATWTALGADRPGTGSTITVIDNIAGRQRRFYRLAVN